MTRSQLEARERFEQMPVIFLEENNKISSSDLGSFYRILVLLFNLLHHEISGYISRIPQE